MVLTSTVGPTEGQGTGVGKTAPSKLLPGDDKVTTRLARFLGEAAGGAATIAGLSRLGGGAIQENWRIDISFAGGPMAGGPMAGKHALVLRASAPSRVPYSHSRTQEFALLEAAFGAGVTVPEPLWACDDAGVIGAPFLVMRHVDGISLAQKIVRDPALDGVRDALAERLGEELAKIHGIRPGHAGLDFLASPEPSPAAAAIAAYRAYLDGHDAPHPAIEWGLRWAERNATPSGEVVLCHRDFRTGNYVVDPGAAGGAAGHGVLTGILDWEFAGWGDPMEDVAWFCAKCWRFGANHREAGGIAGRERFHDAYRRASGREIAADAIAFWEVMAHARWAVIALQQAERHLSGAEPSLELAAIGRRPAEMELEMLRLTAAA